MCTFEHVLGRLVELPHVALLDVPLLQLLNLCSKVSSVAHQFHILYLTQCEWSWFQPSKMQFEKFPQFWTWDLDFDLGLENIISNINLFNIMMFQATKSTKNGKLNFGLFHAENI